MATTLENLKATIDAAVRQHFPKVEVHDVRVAEDTDQDGDSVLNVDVVIARPERLDGKAVMSLVRHLRADLDAVGEGRFPHVSFMTLRDVEDGPAAA